MKPSKRNKLLLRAGHAFVANPERFPLLDELRARSSMVAIAYELSRELHEDEIDRRGITYFNHTRGVAESAIVSWRSQPLRRQALQAARYTLEDTVCISLLHDSLEKVIDAKRPPGQPVELLLRERLEQFRGVVIAGINGFTYIPNRNLSAFENVVAQGNQILAVPALREIKPLDQGNNMRADRVFPYNSGAATVRQVWKNILMSKVIGGNPSTLQRGFTDLPEIVRALPTVQDMIDGNRPLELSPKEDPELMTFLDTNFPGRGPLEMGRAVAAEFRELPLPVFG